MNNLFNKIVKDPKVQAARQAVDNLPPVVRRVAKVGAAGVAVGGAVFVTPPLLGFTTAGVAAGSIAAGLQSAIYGGAVSAGSWFAVMQSVGATATIVPALVAGTTTAAGVAAAIGGDGNGEPPASVEGGNNAGDENNDEGPEKDEECDDDINEKVLVADPGPSQNETNTLNEGTGGHELVRSRNNSR
ncbi:hypothetical protein FS749_002827 [Ceratobasidium sp. UAMH 11750]|nr:hypothetical protein FS749_002827 [Ceratobasidium sp. UAMH 11750]